MSYQRWRPPAQRGLDRQGVRFAPGLVLGDPVHHYLVSPLYLPLSATAAVSAGETG